MLDYYYVFNSQLSSISSDLFGDAQSIIESISYDGRGNIDQMIYGNGTVTNYKYADRTWNLMGSMVIGKPSGGSTAVPLLDRTYSYNSLGVIGSINRVMDQSLVQPGETDHTFSFSYDAYNRLLQGGLDISGVGPSYDVSTSFNDAGGITSKMSNVSQGSQTLAANAAEMTYDLSYNYNASKPHQLDVVVDQISGNSQHFTYNGSGSIKQIQDNSQTQDFYWNEEQWLNAVQNDKGIHHYIYDHTGERIMKSSVIQTNVYVNDQIVGTIQELEPYTLYVNPYFVITEFSNADKVSKHYYMGSQRVASELAVQTTSYSPRIGVSGASQGGTSISGLQKTNSQSLGTVDAELENQSSSIPSDPWLNNLNEALSDFGVAPLLLEVVNKELPTIESIYPDLSPHTSYKTSSTQRVFYWYHPDYIGNVDLVTDLSGEAYELFLYNPWGENLYEWNSGTSTWTSPYRFNGKELDQETGFHYYGARYSNPFISMWLSVDFMASKGLNISPYSFSHDSPTTLLDIDGNWPDNPQKLTKAAIEAVDYVKGRDKVGEMTAQCNVGVNHAFKSLTGSSELSGLRANEMYDQMTISSNFTPVQITEVQALANQGEIVIAAWKNPSGASGHVALAVPGESAASGTWAGQSAKSLGGIPKFMDTGVNTRTSSRSVNYSFGKDKQPEVVFFKFSSPEIGLYQVYDEQLRCPILRFMPNNQMNLEFTPFGDGGPGTIWYKTQTSPPTTPKINNTTPTLIPKVDPVQISTKAFHPVISDLQ